MDSGADIEEMIAKQEKLSHWDEWSQEEKDLLILQRTLSSYMEDEKAEKFIKKVCESAGRERTSWKE